MSGGSYNYGYYNIEQYIGNMKDKELDNLMQDIRELLHDLEWCDSGDTSEETYLEQIKIFKNKWFKQSRSKRLEKIILEEIEKTKQDLLKMIGE